MSLESSSVNPFEDDSSKSHPAESSAVSPLLGDLLNESIEPLATVTSSTASLTNDNTISDPFATSVTSPLAAASVSTSTVVSPIRSPVLNQSDPLSSSPAAPAAASAHRNSRAADDNGDADGIYTPRTLARKIAAHQSNVASRISDQFESSSDVFENPAFQGVDEATAPRFICVVGSYKLKGDGLDTHTRYEIATKWKASVVEASAAAVDRAKAEKSAKQQDEDGDGASSSASSDAPSLLTKIPSTSKVGRRYTDFVFLQQVLTQLYPAYLIPCLPPKGLLQRFDEEFINQRRRGLQRFLKDLSLMPSVVCEERLVTDFLLAPTKEWEAILAHAQQTHHMGGAKNNWLIQGTMSFTKNLITSMTRNPSQEDHIHDDHYHSSVESSVYHQQLQENYDHLNARFDEIVEKERDLADQWMEWYAGFEEADDSMQSSRIAHTHDLLGLDFAQFLPLTQRIGLIQLKKSETEVVSINELLHHTSGMIHQIQELFKRRLNVSNHVQTADANCKQAAAQVEIIRKRVALGEKTADDEQRAQSNVIQCQAILRDRQASLASFHAIAEEQIRSYTTVRRKEMKQVIVDFIQIQLANEENIKNHWARLLDQMNKKR